LFVLLLVSGLAAGCNPRRASSPVPDAQGPSIHWQQPDALTVPTAVAVAGIDPAVLEDLSRAKPDPAQRSSLFSVQGANGSAPPRDDQPPVLGSYHIENGILRFDPQFPFQRGIRYRAVFDPRRLPGRSDITGEPIVAEFLLPRPPSVATTVVQHVFP